MCTRNPGTLWAATSSWRLFGHLDFVLCALRVLRPRDQRNGDITQASTIIRAKTITHCVTQTNTITQANTITRDKNITQDNAIAQDKNIIVESRSWRDRNLKFGPNWIGGG